MVSFSAAPQRVDPNTNQYYIRLRFSGGTATVADAGDIDVREDAGGANFALNLDTSALTPRKPFDLIATAPNAGEIRGIIELIKSDGSVSTLIQAGGNVYSWDGEATFTLVGTVSANAKLRGGRHSTSQVDDKVLIADLNLVENVKTWDGSTFEDLTTSVPNFKARYILVDNERALYGDVSAAGVATPHLLVVSGRGATSTATDLGEVTVTVRPGSALDESDPAYMPTPDTRAINGLELAFGLILISTNEGRVWKLSGSSSKNYAIEGFYSNSAAAGAEAIAVIGNDVLVGQPGRIDTLVGSERFGDVRRDDPSRVISDKISDVREWKIVHNPRESRTYLWPKDGSSLWTFATNLYVPAASSAVEQEARADLSPWAEWKTTAGDGDFRQTAAALARRSTDKIDVVYFGGRAGQIYQLEGDGDQDAGTDDVTVQRLTGFIGPPIGGYENIQGYIDTKKGFASEITLTVRQLGTSYDLDVDQTVSIPALSNIPTFGGAFYFGGDVFFNTEFNGRVARQQWSSTGDSSFFQLLISYVGPDPEITEIGIFFEASPE